MTKPKKIPLKSSKTIIIILSTLLLSTTCFKISPKISISKESDDSIFRIHKIQQKAPSLKISGTSLTQEEDTFILELQIPVALESSLSFYKREREGLLSHITPSPPTSTQSNFVIQQKGDMKTVNSFFESLYIENIAKTNRSVESGSFFLEYTVKGFNSMVEKYKYEVELASTLLTSTMVQYNTFTIQKDARFTYNIIEIQERDSILLQSMIEIKVTPVEYSTRFYSTLEDNIVQVHGSTEKMADSDLEFNPPPEGINLAVSVKLQSQKERSLSYSFHFVIEESLNAEALTIVLIFIVVAMLAFLIVCLLMIYIAKKEQQEKQKVAEAIEGPKEDINVLTKSIVMWKGEENSTKPSTLHDKSSVLYNPYEQFSLKNSSGRGYGGLNNNSLGTMGSSGRNSKGFLHHQTDGDDDEEEPNYAAENTDAGIEVADEGQMDGNEKDLLDVFGGHDNKEMNNISHLNFSKAVYGEDQDRTLGIDFGDVSQIGANAGGGLLGDKGGNILPAQILEEDGVLNTSSGLQQQQQQQKNKEEGEEEEEQVNDMDEEFQDGQLTNQFHYQGNQSSQAGYFQL